MSFADANEQARLHEEYLCSAVSKGCEMNPLTLLTRPSSALPGCKGSCQRLNQLIAPWILAYVKWVIQSSEVEKWQIMKLLARS